MLQFHTYCSDCVHAADIRIVVDNLERFKDLDIRCWELFLTDHSYCAIAGLYSMLLDVVVPLDGVEDEELISKFLSWLGFLTKLLPASGYQRIPIQMRLIANLAQILKAYPNERIASLLANILELIARNHDGDRIDASVNQTGLKNCLHTILSCFDSLYLRDSHILVKLTVLINNMIVTKDILSFMSGCPNLDMYRDAFCRYWNLGNSIMFYVPVIQSIFSLPETFFTNDDAKIIVNTLLNTLETSNDSSISNLLINCLKSITSESRFRDLGEATAKRALFIVNNLVEWHEPEPAQSEKLDSFPHSQSFEFHTSKPKPSSQRRTSLQAIQFQLACIADS